jgi:DNA-directed RNA polymerase subunit E'/Rpb7
MKINLKKKVEKKCNKNGFVDEVHRIINYSDGKLHAENLAGTAIYDISYHCRLCLPIEGTIIIGQIRIINPEVVIAINGPIMIFIPRDYVNTDIWNIINYTHKTKPNVKLNPDDYVKIRIKNKRINRNDSQIKVMGELLDLADENEIISFFGQKQDLNNNNDESNYI